MDKPNPMYSEGMPESEILRMRELEYPSKISASLLPENLTNKKIADIGAGPNPDLGKIVKSRGGTYFAFDLNQKMAKIQKTFADNTYKKHLAADSRLVHYRHFLCKTFHRIPN